MLALDAHPYATEFRNAATKEWRLPSSSSNPEENKKTSGKTVGEFRAAHGDSKKGAGDYVFVSVHEAG
jgi:hypothetical protein